MILIKKPSTTGLVKKTSLDAKVKEIEDKIPGCYKFVTTREFDKLTNISFDTKTKEAMKFLTTESGTKNALHVIDKNKKYWIKYHQKDVAVLCRMYFTGIDGYQNFLVFHQCLIHIG